ncbi:MAG: hypothetical protein A2063_03600 [Gallionellales bacterium GWA2_60_142]|nr:MAG: hypothetical protein A2063_03600 [Gallionellales bacterium GWA2_60_142]HCI14022.1 chemotaxis protein [Gallionellaceae bacterium]
MKYLIAMSIMVALVFAWVAVQAAARNYAARHPEFGPLREDGKEGCGGCGNHCAGHCDNDH